MTALITALTLPPCLCPCVLRQHAAVVSSAGRVWTWGRGRAGRLGHGSEKEHVKLKPEPALIAQESWQDHHPTRVFAQVRLPTCLLLKLQL
eukprot:COSAG01_NODE_11700_length_1877_cov_1.623735_2_plen_91_part_00